jgi:hypothetical protein
VKPLATRSFRLLAGVVGLVVCAPARADDGWRRVDEKKGITVEKRAVPGSPWNEYRASARHPLPPERIFEAARADHRDDPRSRRYVKRYQVIRETDHERLVYEQVSAPVVSDRDYTVLIQWSTDPARRIYEIRFKVANDAGPPPVKGFVRIPDIHGYWRIEAAPEGGSLIEYVVYSDPGGSIPAWIARGAQVDSTRNNVLDCFSYAEERRPPQ